MDKIKLPEAFEKLMEDMLKDEYPLFKEAFEKPENYVGIRVNSLKEGSIDAVLKKSPDMENVPWCKNGFYGDKEILSGIHISFRQDES